MSQSYTVSSVQASNDTWVCVCVCVCICLYKIHSFLIS